MRVLGLALCSLVAVSATSRQAAPDSPGFSQKDVFQQNQVWTAPRPQRRKLSALQPRYGAGSATVSGFLDRTAAVLVSARRGIEFDYVHASFEIGGRKFEDVAVR
jgi:hypothetical protein